MIRGSCNEKWKKKGVIVDNFTDLVKFAKNLKEKNKNISPVLANVPDRLKNFATNTTDALMKAKLRFDNLLETNNTRSEGLEDKKTQNNILLVTNWVVTALRHLIERVEEQGEIITLHTEALANPQEAIFDPKDEEIENLKNKVEKLSTEVDETRQRGMKGNIIVSSPDSQKKKTEAVHNPVGEGTAVLENDTAMIIRLIKRKTGVDVPEKDIDACHPMGKKKDSHTYVIRFSNRKPGSAWHTLTHGMGTGKNFDNEFNLYLNYQLTNKRAALAKLVRTAKSKKNISKFFIDQNGRIKVKKSADDKEYTEVKSEADLQSL